MSHAVVLVALDAGVASSDIEQAVAHQMSPYDENEEWFRDGSRWDWYVIGGRWSHFFGEDTAIVRAHALNLEARAKERVQSLTAYYTETMAKDPKGHSLITGIGPGETLEQYLASHGNGRLSAGAFLRERHWHEGGRMGWFGMKMATECEMATGTVPRRCHSQTVDAHLTTWNEEDVAWTANFEKRFIEPLSPDSWLVAVDYHV